MRSSPTWARFDDLRSGMAHRFPDFAYDLEAWKPEHVVEVIVLWGEQPRSAKPGVEHHRQVEIRATVAPAPYVQEVRDSYRKS